MKKFFKNPIVMFIVGGTFVTTILYAAGTQITDPFSQQASESDVLTADGFNAVVERLSVCENVGDTNCFLKEGSTLELYDPFIDYGEVQNNPGESCFDILTNRNDIDGTDSNDNGIYWIDTTGGDTTDAFQVYCDMSTDGGGWTLVGKGREGWDFSDSGKSTSMELYSNKNTNTVAYLSSSQIQSILGKNWDQSVDGLKVQRMNVGNTVHLFPGYSTLFNWAVLYNYGTNGNKLGTTKIYEGGTLVKTINGDITDNRLPDQTSQGASNDCYRMFTRKYSGHNYVDGFSAGDQCNVTSGTRQYGSEGHVIDRVNVYVRN